jgi:LPS-assembly protein
MPALFRRAFAVWPAALLVVLAAAGHAETPTLTPVLTGRETSYDDRSGELVVRGDAKIVYGDITLAADEIRYERTANQVRAHGHLVIARGDQRLVAEDGTVSLADRSVHVHGAKLGQFPVYLTGDSVDGPLDDLTLTNATVFFREEASWAPSFTARKLVYRRGRIVSGEGVRVGLLGGHFLSLPRIEHGLGGEAMIGSVSGRLGFRSSLGAFAELGLHLPVADGVQLGGDLGLYTARGILLGPAGAYQRGAGDDSMRGFFRSGYINDHGDRLADILGDPVPEDRSYFEWQHQQKIGPHFTLNGQFNYWSDSEVLRDFKPSRFFPVQQPDSFLEGAYTGDNYVLSAFTRVNPNPFFRMQERLPEVRFDLLPSPTPVPGLYQRVNASFAELEEDAYQNIPGRRSTRLDACYSLERPVALAPWLTFTPVAGGRVTYYADATNGRSTYTRTIGEVGFDAALRASGTFDYKNELWEIDGLRHLLEPRLSYRYAPQAGDGQPWIPAIDRRVFTTYLPPLSIADQRNIDDLDRLDTLRLSLNNTLQTRDKTYGSRDLATLNFAADYRFARQPGHRHLSDLYTEATLTPAPWLRFELFHRAALQNSSGSDELNYGVEITDRRWWSVRLASYLLRNDYEQYLLEYRQRINEVFDVIGRWRYDARLSRFNEQTYGVVQRLGQTWSVRYAVNFNQGTQRESHFGFSIAVDLLKF